MSYVHCIVLSLIIVLQELLVKHKIICPLVFTFSENSSWFLLCIHDIFLLESELRDHILSCRRAEVCAQFLLLAQLLERHEIVADSLASNFPLHPITELQSDTNWAQSKRWRRAIPVFEYEIWTAILMFCLSDYILPICRFLIHFSHSVLLKPLVYQRHVLLHKQPFLFAWRSSMVDNR